MNMLLSCQVCGDFGGLGSYQLAFGIVKSFLSIFITVNLQFGASKRDTTVSIWQTYKCYLQSVVAVDIVL